MALNLTMPGQEELKPRITVFGVGGAGGNAVDNMIDKDLQGVDFVVANTDAQALQQSKAESRIQLGVKVTEGLGAGARASVGAAAAEENIEQIVDYLAGAHMCFITAGMGGGTGTGAAPIIAQAARELGVLTVGVVTKPFQFEGAKRMRQAEDGVEALQKMVDTLIIIPNQNLFRLANEKTTFTEAFSLADDVLYQGVKGVTDLMVRPGLINLDFADVRAVMDEMGKAMMGTGEEAGEERAIKAAERAIANPLLDEISLKGAKGVLINITGGNDLTLFELDEAANRIREEVDVDANIIVGSTLDTNMDGVMRVSVVATGIDASEIETETPLPRRTLAEPLKPMVAAEVEPEMPAAEVATMPAVPAEPAALETAAEQPAFFDDFDAEHVAQKEQVEDIFEAPAQAVPVHPSEVTPQPMHAAASAERDDLPPPAYQPEPAQAAPEAFVAPQAPAPGTPSPEAVARLRQAVENNPNTPAATPSSSEQADQDKPRFGINSLINRMTGQGQEPRPTLPASQPPVTANLSAHAPAPAPAAEENDDQIEIPAFLRRQAN